MDIYVKFIPYDVNGWELKRQIANVVHSKEFPVPRDKDDDSDTRVINFEVKLNPSRIGGAYSDGTATLVLPSATIGNRFLDWIRDNPLKVNHKKLRFSPTKKLPPKYIVETLRKTPYISPDIDEERAEKINALDEVPLRVDEVQFGVFYRSYYPKSPKEPLPTRAFSVEWEAELVQRSLGWMRFEYDHKLIRIRLGDEATEKIGYNIVITFASISKIGVGYDPKPYLCFDTLTPPILHQIDFHRPLTGDEKADNTKFRRRIGALHPGHARVASYAHHLRIILYNDRNEDMISVFTRLCKIAGLPPTLIIRAQSPAQVIEAQRRQFFSAKRLFAVQRWLSRLDWPIAFQLESLLHNALLNTDDLLVDLYEPVNKLCKAKAGDGGRFAGEILRRYGEALRSRPLRESPLQCFNRIIQEPSYMEPNITAGRFICSHVTFTPTRMILEGPYVTQSNRIIRQYPGQEDNFIRVDFRDEDRLQYRWDRDVDGTSYLYERVGGILKNGFDLGGKHFEFLAYSSSALREHAVWFMQPFKYYISKSDTVELITSDTIRRGIGDFHATADLINRPSLYAARLAQAFTATDSSVTIVEGEWEEVPDIGTKPYIFTDGCGTITKKLGDRIWEALCADRRDHGRNAIQPSVYQIRFLGYKGVVSVDEELDKSGNGIQMRLRPSMRKFKSPPVKEAEVEIARAFEYPNSSYLNRALVMVLEDHKVRKEAFLELQELAVADARMIHDSIARFRSVLESYTLGTGYRLSYLLQRLNELGLDFYGRDNEAGIESQFLNRLRYVSMNHVLRDIKHKARIRIPDSYLVVGVADEGPAYKAAGYKDVYELPKGKIYACIQRPGDAKPTWLEGACFITRSPVVHPGDVQRVVAIGQPPSDQFCTFRHLKNVVVLPSVGERSLASCLGGGDLDGDLYDVVQCPTLLFRPHVEPADYEGDEPWTLDRETTVDDICDFIVEYINSDVLGLLSDRHLVIADQSKLGTSDPHCLELAQLCSKAVDYPKKGIPVDIDNLPRTLIRCKPDWHAAEVIAPRTTDYYQSDRALGHLYRAVTLQYPDSIPASEAIMTHPLLADPISTLLRRHIQEEIGIDLKVSPEGSDAHIAIIFSKYVNELRYICATHTLSTAPGVQLIEEEIVIGTILAKCSQSRWRSDRAYRMRLHASTLVRDVQRELIQRLLEASGHELLHGLDKAWKAWSWSQRLLHHTTDHFGANSFALIALGAIFDIWERLKTVA